MLVPNPSFETLIHPIDDAANYVFHLNVSSLRNTLGFKNPLCYNFTHLVASFSLLSAPLNKSSIGTPSPFFKRSTQFFWKHIGTNFKAHFLLHFSALTQMVVATKLIT